jgi:hypothetical protein
MQKIACIGIQCTVSSTVVLVELSLKISSVHTLAQAKLDLANKEVAEKKNGMIGRHEMSPSNFILAVFDIEKKLYVPGFFYYSWELISKYLASAALKKKEQKCSQTLTKKASLQIKHNQIHHHMQTLQEVQKIYIPGAASLETDFTHENACHRGKSMTASHDDGSALGGILLLIYCYA